MYYVHIRTREINGTSGVEIAIQIASYTHKWLATSIFSSCFVSLQLVNTKSRFSPQLEWENRAMLVSELVRTVIKIIDAMLLSIVHEICDGRWNMCNDTTRRYTDTSFMEIMKVIFIFLYFILFIHLLLFWSLC